MRIAVHACRIDANLLQRVRDDLATFIIISASPVNPQPFLDNLEDAETGTERAERILKDDLHCTAQWSHAF